jgi:methyl-accepting chemotaxis protein
MNSIFFRLFIPIVVVLLVGLVIILNVIPAKIEQSMTETVMASASQTVNQYKILRKYYVKNVVKKVIAGSTMRPAIEHNGHADKIPLPATMIHDLSHLIKSDNTELALYSQFPFPNRKNRQLDDFANIAWDKLTRNPKQNFMSRVTEGGHEYIRIAVADVMVEGCVNCHNNHPQTPKNDWQIGGYPWRAGSQS